MKSKKIRDKHYRQANVFQQKRFIGLDPLQWQRQALLQGQLAGRLAFVLPDPVQHFNELPRWPNSNSASSKASIRRRQAHSRYTRLVYTNP